MNDFIVKMIDKELVVNPTLSFLDALDIVRIKISYDDDSSGSFSFEGEK